MRPDPQSRALREIVSDLAGTVVGTTYLTARLNGGGVRYELPGGHPLTGRSTLDLELTEAAASRTTSTAAGRFCSTSPTTRSSGPSLRGMPAASTP
ncbi:hypothetical protein ACIQ7Q_24365 [Streptomyces sp. NPDC096176]|uniref:hypothetical protein n=1 Tax=Streptomyces sp. NPDC096176 TaxID=3366079 RepID=UPI00380E5294